MTGLSIELDEFKAAAHGRMDRPVSFEEASWSHAQTLPSTTQQRAGGSSTGSGGSSWSP